VGVFLCARYPFSDRSRTSSRHTHAESCITQLKAQGPASTCNESKEEDEDSCGEGLVDDRGMEGRELFAPLGDTHRALGFRIYIRIYIFVSMLIYIYIYVYIYMVCRYVYIYIYYMCVYAYNVLMTEAWRAERFSRHWGDTHRVLDTENRNQRSETSGGHAPSVRTRKPKPEIRNP